MQSDSQDFTLEKNDFGIYFLEYKTFHWYAFKTYLEEKQLQELYALIGSMLGKDS